MDIKQTTIVSILSIDEPIGAGARKENTRGIGNKNWFLDFIAKTVIVLPPIEEQQRNALEEIETSIEVVETRLYNEVYNS